MGGVAATGRSDVGGRWSGGVENRTFPVSPAGRADWKAGSVWNSCRESPAGNVGRRVTVTPMLIGYAQGLHRGPEPRPANEGRRDGTRGERYDLSDETRNKGFRQLTDWGPAASGTRARCPQLNSSTKVSAPGTGVKAGAVAAGQSGVRGRLGTRLEPHSKGPLPQCLLARTGYAGPPSTWSRLHAEDQILASLLPAGGRRHHW